MTANLNRDYFQAFKVSYYTNASNLAVYSAKGINMKDTQLLTGYFLLEEGQIKGI
jgi:hypothetical protein